jgi:GH24 family phage-related lysozyme (muramidase)
MDMDRLLASVKKHEGYRNKVYLDTLGKRTVGVGHLCVEAQMISWQRMVVWI